jgi:preprotein translocase subunit SecE
MSEGKISRIGRFFGEVRTEMQKVTWPSKDELIGSTIVVLVFSALLAVYVGAIDAVCRQAIQILIRMVS